MHCVVIVPDWRIHVPIPLCHFHALVRVQGGEAMRIRAERAERAAGAERVAPVELVDPATSVDRTMPLVQAVPFAEAEPPAHIPPALGEQT